MPDNPINMGDNFFKVDGVDYTTDGIEAVRQGLIHMRHGEMTDNPDRVDWQQIMLLSHAIALLAAMKEALTYLDRSFPKES